MTSTRCSSPFLQSVASSCLVEKASLSRREIPDHDASPRLASRHSLSPPAAITAKIYFAVSGHRSRLISLPSAPLAARGAADDGCHVKAIDVSRARRLIATSIRGRLVTRRRPSGDTDRKFRNSVGRAEYRSSTANGERRRRQLASDILAATGLGRTRLVVVRR